MQTLKQGLGSSCPQQRVRILSETRAAYFQVAYVANPSFVEERSTKTVTTSFKELRIARNRALSLEAVTTWEGIAGTGVKISQRGHNNPKKTVEEFPSQIQLGAV